jgi:protein MpaA
MSDTTTNTIQLIKKPSNQINPKNILIIGVFHGEEPQGEYVIKRYLENENISDTKNHLFFIPCLNPWGKERGVRGNHNGVDLNRNYPTKNWIETEKDEFYSGTHAASELITRQMTELLKELKPDIILTLHAPLKCVNYDGPAKVLAEKIAEFCEYPVIADLGYPTPGSFGTYCGVERNIPTITLEYDDKEDYESIYRKTEKIFDWLAVY